MPVVKETPEYTDYEEYDATARCMTYRRVWKAGTPEALSVQAQAAGLETLRQVMDASTADPSVGARLAALERIVAADHPELLGAPLPAEPALTELQGPIGPASTVPGPKGDKGDPGPPGGGVTAKLTADQAALTLTTLANLSGLSFPVVAGKTYKFSAQVIFRSVALTTGFRLGLTCPAFTVLACSVNLPFAADGSGAIFHGVITTSGDSVMSTGVPAINTDLLGELRGTIMPSANGTVQLQGATEIAASGVTVRRGSSLTVEDLGV